MLRPTGKMPFQTISQGGEERSAPSPMLAEMILSSSSIGQLL